MIKWCNFIEEKPLIRDLIDARGREVVDRTPLKFDLPDKRYSMLDYIQALYMERQRQDAEGVETLEDANNFDIPDEVVGIEEINTPYEIYYDNLERAKYAEQTASAPVETPAEPLGNPEGS